MPSVDDSTPGEMPPHAIATAGRRADSPPRPPLVLRVGVTGHRPDSSKRPDPDVQQLLSVAGEIFERIANAFEGVADTHGDQFDFSGDKPHAKHRGTLRVVSALAAGADQWLAEKAVDRGYELQCPLPFRRHEYRHDFAGDDPSAARYDTLLEKATAVCELDGKIGTDSQGQRVPNSQSYEAVGRLLLDQSDILVAIWDGNESHGKGGTGQIVSEALYRGIPVVWIGWARQHEWRLLYPPWRLLKRIEDVEGDSERLTKQVRDLLLPPEQSVPVSVAEGVDLRKAYFHERQKRANPVLGWWRLFRDVICCEFWMHRKQWSHLVPFRVFDFIDSTKEQWARLWNVEEVVDAESQSRRTRHIGAELVNHVYRAYLVPYAWANELSVYYASLYRSSFVLIYLLGACAVLLAVVGIAMDEENPLAKIAVWIELALIVLVISLTFLGRHWRWHERWIDYRTLAERLRLASFLAILGGGGQQVSMAGHLAKYGNPATTWMHWHYRAIERAAGLPAAVFDEDYLKICKALWAKSLVREQNHYHAANQRRFHQLDHVLHLAASIMFIATCCVCLAHIAVDYGNDHYDLPSWLNRSQYYLIMLAAFFPAAGAGLAAIRTQGEFPRVVRRSAAMRERLAELEVDLASLPTGAGELNSVRLRQCAEKVSNLMINETLDWRVVFQDRPLGLPA